MGVKGGDFKTIIENKKKQRIHNHHSCHDGNITSLECIDIAHHKLSSHMDISAKKSEKKNAECKKKRKDKANASIFLQFCDAPQSFCQESSGKGCEKSCNH